MRLKRTILILFLLVTLAGLAYALYMWNQPHRDVTKEEGITIAAPAIFDSFVNDEATANTLFLNKAIQVTGEVAEVKQNQAGQVVVYLKTNDPIFGVNCTFREHPGPIEKSSTITFKGVCTGYLSDVIINQGIIVRK